MSNPLRRGASRQAIWRGLLLIAGVIAVWIGVLIYRFEPSSTISIENCGAREYFRQQLDTADIKYKRLPNGDFHFDAKPELEKLAVLKKGEHFLEIPESVKSRDWKNCRTGQ